MRVNQDVALPIIISTEFVSFPYKPHWLRIVCTFIKVCTLITAMNPIDKISTVVGLKRTNNRNYEKLLLRLI